MSDSPYLTAKEAAAYVKRRSVAAFDMWCYRNGVRPDKRAGRIRLYTVKSLERVLNAMAKRPAA